MSICNHERASSLELYSDRDNASFSSGHGCATFRVCLVCGDTTLWLRCGVGANAVGQAFRLTPLSLDDSMRLRRM